MIEVPITTEMVANILETVKKQVREAITSFKELSVMFDVASEQINVEGTFSTEEDGDFTFEYDDENWRHQPVLLEGA